MLVFSPPTLAIISTLTRFDESMGKTACSLATPGAKRRKLYCAAFIGRFAPTSCEYAGTAEPARVTRIVSVMALIFIRCLLLIT
jgi:hypothetical protein